MDFISENLKIIILALIALFAGFTITFRIRKKINKNNSTKVTQSNNTVSGDMAGRDIHKK